MNLLQIISNTKIEQAFGSVQELWVTLIDSLPKSHAMNMKSRIKALLTKERAIELRSQNRPEGHYNQQGGSMQDRVSHGRNTSFGKAADGNKRKV